ncbi:MAG: cysteine-rich CWC family protein [Bacteroidetes bacterium]|nr:cysteine-rich CWC family protein [Bacteroidota bacterium]
MSNHETTYCPRCSKTFECRAGNITQCQCYGVQLTVEERAYVETLYNDCLCRTCLLQMKNDYIHFKNQFIFRAKKHR